MLGVVQGAGVIFNFININPVQWWMITTVGLSRGQMQAGLFPFGQTQCSSKFALHVLGRGFEVTGHVASLPDFANFVDSDA